MASLPFKLSLRWYLSVNFVNSAMCSEIVSFSFYICLQTQKHYTHTSDFKDGKLCRIYNKIQFSCEFIEMQFVYATSNKLVWNTGKPPFFFTSPPPHPIISLYWNKLLNELIYQIFRNIWRITLRKVRV